LPTWLAQQCNPAISPHKKRIQNKTGTHHTGKISVRNNRRGKGGEGRGGERKKNWKKETSW